MCSYAAIFKDSADRPPEVIGVAAVLPAPVAQDPEVAGATARDDEVKAVAMQVALAYE